MQDGLDVHPRLTAYLTAKLMQEVQRWVFEHPPPDMAAAMAEKAAKVRRVACVHVYYHCKGVRCPALA